MRLHPLMILTLSSISCASTAPTQTSQPGMSGATSDPAASVGTSTDVGGLWMLTTIAGKPARAGSTLELNDGRVAGHSGCNSYGSVYTVTGAQMSMGQIIRTEMACDDAQAMSQENLFLSMLETSTNAARTGDTLVLQGAGGELVFSSAATKEPRATWKLEIIYYSDGAATPLPGRDITATFGTDDLTADLGCNTVSGSYAMNGSLMKVAELVSSARACAGDDGASLMAQEGALAQMLQNTTSFTVEDDGRLVLYNRGYPALQWILVSSN